MLLWSVQSPDTEHPGFNRFKLKQLKPGCSRSVRHTAIMAKTYFPLSLRNRLKFSKYSNEICWTIPEIREQLHSKRETQYSLLHHSLYYFVRSSLNVVITLVWEFNLGQSFCKSFRGSCF